MKKAFLITTVTLAGLAVTTVYYTLSKIVDGAKASIGG